VSLFDKFGLIYFLIPFLFIIENKWSVIFSILLGRSTYNIKIKDAPILKFQSYEYSLMISVLGVLTYSTEFNFKNNNQFEISFDLKNKFLLSLDRSSLEDINLIQTLFGGLRHGADFEMSENFIDDNVKRDKSFKIFKNNGRRIIQTTDGIKFYLDSIHPGNTIVETFVQKIHQVNSKQSFDGKIVVDIGAECGDTALFYSKLGAKVFAFEPIKEHFNQLIENINLNQKLKERITPINAAIGKDGELIFHYGVQSITKSTSFIKNIHEKRSREEKVTGYSFKSAFKKFDIEKIDLLKMDCKGCECFLKENDLTNVDSIKIEYDSEFASLKLDKLLEILEKAGFRNIIYRINPISNRISNRDFCHIFGTKN
tara:strand:- start:10786 stop:11895 length:1110 start_codon:yes stop_codon:yes gene_type:complete